jgi:phospholipid/cholesterol/gamma-HCH transport system substrate-binding protein
MINAIRKNLRNFIAVTVMIVIAAAVSLYIVQNQRLRIPVLEERPFELKAEFETAQAVVPGQGQTIRVAGVRVGDVQKVELEDGRAVVTFAIDREYLPIYRDATVLLRPMTGLKDMFFQLDPGTQAAGEYEEGDVIPMANTAPDVNLDEILAQLDADNRAYLRLLLTGAGEGLKGRSKELGELLGSLGPINRDLERLQTEVAKRDENLARLVHNLNRLTAAVGRQERDIRRFVSASSVSLGAIAEQSPDLERTAQLLPEALRETKLALTSARGLGDELGPAFQELRPFARNLTDLTSATRSLARGVTPALREQIRPFVRAARPVTPDLRTAAKRFSKAAPRLTVIGEQLNRLGNMAAYNPRGAEAPGTLGRDEGYLYWGAWAGHNGTSVFGAQDGNGLYRRIYFTASCQNIVNLLYGSPGGALVAGIVTGLAPLFEPGAPCG